MFKAVDQIRSGVQALARPLLLGAALVALRLPGPKGAAQLLDDYARMDAAGTRR